MGSQKKRLIQLLEGMNQQQQQTLLDFAEFLQQKNTSTDTTDEKQQPIDHPRPPNENVVAAIKRLRASYFMLNTDQLLNETSTLMAQFMIQGREAESVIDDLETLFENHYQKYLES